MHACMQAGRQACRRQVGRRRRRQRRHNHFSFSPLTPTSDRSRNR
jgi:hypothetical protein